VSGGVLVLLSAALGYGAGDRVSYALLAAAAILLVGMLSVSPLVLPVIAFPSILLLARVGSGTGLSISDAVLFFATICALLELRTRESPELRAMLWLVVAYQAAILPAVVRNHYRASVIEWWHEVFLVAGALVVGWVVGRRGRAPLAIGCFVGLCSVLGVAAAASAPLNHFAPVYLDLGPLFSYHKNALGDLLAIASIVAYARPEWLRWSPKTSNIAVVCCLLGLLATQSKQGIVSAAVGIAVIVVRGRLTGRRSRVIILAMIPMLAFAYVVASDQLHSNNQFNAVHTRFSAYTASLDVWHLSQWFGVGFRWWYRPQFSDLIQPPNAEIEMITSAGIIGLIGFVVTSLIALRLLWRMDPRYGTVGFAVVAARLAQGQLDLFWVASQSSIPWLIVGAALGAQALDRHGARGRAPAGARDDSPDRRVLQSPTATPASTGPSGR
jgi:polysaccharide biosynthesis protein PslJ